MDSCENYRKTKITTITTPSSCPLYPCNFLSSSYTHKDISNHPRTRNRKKGRTTASPPLPFAANSGANPPSAPVVAPATPFGGGRESILLLEVQLIYAARDSPQGFLAVEFDPLCEDGSGIVGVARRVESSVERTGS